MDILENNFNDIDDFIKAIEDKYKTKKKNSYDDESLSHSDGRNSHNNYDNKDEH